MVCSDHNGRDGAQKGREWKMLRTAPMLFVCCLVALYSAACNGDGDAPAGQTDAPMAEDGAGDLPTDAAAPADVGTGGEESTQPVDEIGPDSQAKDSAEPHPDAVAQPKARVQPEDLAYQGAFRLPDDFQWGALGLSYRSPIAGAAEATLFVTGGQSPTNDEGPCYEGSTGCHAYFGEVAIPSPVVADDWESLPVADFVQQLTPFDNGLAHGLSPYTFVAGIEHVPAQGTQTTDKLYGSLEDWYPEGDHGDNTFPTVWFSELDGSNPQGLFHVGPSGDALFHGRKMGDYLFTVPQSYADTWLGGRTVVTGRARGTSPPDAPGMGGEGATAGGSQGPTLIAFRPFAEDTPTGDLDAVPMLFYRVKYPGCAGPDVGIGGQETNCDFPGFTMCDFWTGGAFIENAEQSAVVLVGKTGTTNCYYCGTPADNPQCTVEPLPGECDRHCDEGQGFHCGPYQTRVLLYDTEELGRAAQGEIEPWTVLPYANWEPKSFFTQGPTCYEPGGAAFDRVGRRLFMTERGLGGDTNAAVVHVWTL